MRYLYDILKQIFMLQWVFSGKSRYSGSLKKKSGYLEACPDCLQAEPDSTAEEHNPPAHSCSVHTKSCQ